MRYPPIDPRRASVQLVGGGLLLALLLCVVGWVFVNVASAQAIVAWEGSVNDWFVAQRTPLLDTVSGLGSALSDTVTATAFLVVMVVVTRLWLGRWREAVALVAALVGELLVFLIVTAVVQRDRPDVIQLDIAPPTSSFPSGHTAAAVALYGCIAVIVNREMRTRWLAVLVAAACWAVPAIVGISRLYRGMHHPTDVLFGYLGGGLWLAIVIVTVLPLARGRAAERQLSPPPAGRPLVHQSAPRGSAA
jgi:undecaprenyl-diphosphatase